MTGTIAMSIDNVDISEPLIETADGDSDNNNGRTLTEARDQTTTMSVSFRAAVFVAVMPMFLFGYSTGVMNAPESVIFPSHTISQWSIVVSSFCIGGIIGANVSGRLADRFGRRKCLLAVGGYWNILFGILHVLAPNLVFLIVARVGVGIAGGASTVLTPMYLSEIAPTKIRGSVGTMTQLSCVLGIMASILVALPFSTEQEWRFIFLPIPLVGALFVLTGRTFLLESPRWLLLNHREVRGHEARYILRQFRHGDYSEEDVEIEVVQIIGAPAVEETVLVTDDSINAGVSNESDLDTMSCDHEAVAIVSSEEEQPFPIHAAGSTVVTNQSHSQTTFATFVFDPKNRIPLLSSILFPVAQQLSGINAVFYYSTTFFEGVIDNPQKGTLLAFSVNVIATIIAVFLMDRFGRRTLLSWSAGGMCLCCILLTLALSGFLQDTVAVIAVLLYISFFEVGLGCIPFFIASEMIEPQFLGTVQSISMSANWLSNFCVGVAFPYMNKYLGAFSFVPFAVVLFGTVVFAVVWLPETRGKTLEEVMLELGKGHQTATTRSGDRREPLVAAETIFV